MATGDLHKTFGEDRSSGLKDGAHTQTHIQTDKLIAILRSPTGAEKKTTRKVIVVVVIIMVVVLALRAC